MNILITGGAGFIGSALSLRLLRQGHHIKVLDNLSPQVHGEVPDQSALYLKIKDKIDFILGDVRSKDDWRLALKGIDCVVHLAAETGTGQSMYEIQKYIDVNIKGTANLLELLANEHHNIKKIVVASSRAVYGEGRYLCSLHGEVFPEQRSEGQLMNRDFDVRCPFCGAICKEADTREDSIIHPASIYGLTKFAQENMCMTTGIALDISVAALRYQNVFGPGQSLKNPYTGILSIFSTRIKNGNDINVFEDGKESRDFIYIDDVVEATIKAIEREEANNQIFNVGTGYSIDVQHVAATLVQKYKADVRINVSGQYRIGDIRHNFADITKIKDKLNFVPQYQFEQGIEYFVDWVNSQRVEEDHYEAAILEMASKGLHK